MAQLNDLIVTGKSRFLNEINGQIDWSNVLSKPATYAPTIGTTSTTALAGDTKYAGASTAGGAATSAAKLTNTSKIGDTNKPVYFTANGVPSAISYTIDKSVPSTAVFTDANVTQTSTNTSGSDYELLFSSTADNTTRTEGARKSKYLTYGIYDPQTIPSSTTVSGSLRISADSTASGTSTVTNYGININGLDLIKWGGTSTWGGISTSLDTAVGTAKTTVTQTATDSTNSNYELLFSSTADNTTRTEGARKTSGLKFNPNGRNITLTSRTVASDYCSFYPTSISFNSEKYNSSLSNSTIYLDYINDTDHRRMSFTPYGNTYSPCIEISADDTSGTNFRYMYYTDSDIVLYSGGNMVTTWDGTNTSLRAALADTGWIAVNSNKQAYRKVGKIVFVKDLCLGSTTVPAAGSYTTFFTLPVGYRPSGDYYYPAISRDGSNTMIIIRIATDGTVSGMSTGVSKNVHGFCVSFPVGS